MCWQRALSAELGASYFAELCAFVDSERALQPIYPEESKVFRAFTATPLAQVRIALLGQDPYHGKGQAQGLCFSVPAGFAHPPSLALGGVASALLVMLVLIGLSRTIRPPVTPPSRTLTPESVTITAPNTGLRQAHVIITSGQAIIQKPSGQTEMVAAGTTIHWLAPGDRLITGKSSARARENSLGY